MNGKHLMVRVVDAELLDIADIRERPKAQTLYDIHLYSHLERKAQKEHTLRNLVPVSPDSQEIMFIHSSGEYIGQAQNQDTIIPPCPPTLPSAHL